MPTAIRFDGAENTHVHDDCFDLPTMVQMVPFGENQVPQVTSCWQFSPEEMQTLQQNGGCIFICIIGGQPPISVSMEKPEVKKVTWEFTEIAQRLKEEYNTAKIRHHGKAGRILLTVSGVQFDLSKEEWEHVQNLYADL